MTDKKGDNSANSKYFLAYNVRCAIFHCNAAIANKIVTAFFTVYNNNKRSLSKSLSKTVMIFLMRKKTWIGQRRWVVNAGFRGEN